MLNTFEKKNLNGENYKIAIVKARFNKEVTDGLLDGALKALDECNVSEENIFTIEVPGAFEIPITAQKLAETKKYNAIVCLGAIIKGETRHDEYIAQSTTKGMIDVALKYNIPVLLGVITALNLKQAYDRSMNNTNNKGYESTLSAIETLNNLRIL